MRISRKSIMGALLLALLVAAWIALTGWVVIRRSTCMEECTAGGWGRNKAQCEWLCGDGAGGRP